MCDFTVETSTNILEAICWFDSPCARNASTSSSRRVKAGIIAGPEPGPDAEPDPGPEPGPDAEPDPGPEPELPRGPEAGSASPGARPDVRAGELPGASASCRALTTARVAAGESTASPRWTSRTAARMRAGSSDFTRYPSAPAASAPSTYSSRSKPELTRTLAPVPRRRGKLTMPVTHGVGTSVSTAAGRACRAARGAEVPAAAWAATGRS